MARKVYLQGGPKDGEYVTIHGNWKEVVFAEDPPIQQIGALPCTAVVRKFTYSPQGRRTRQGVEVFECD